MKWRMKEHILEGWSEWPNEVWRNEEVAGWLSEELGT